MSNELDPDVPASEQLDLTTGMTFDLSPDEIRAFANELRQAEAYEGDDAGELADYVAALKELESQVEETRKEIFEAQLDEYVHAGDRVGPLSKVEGSRRYVTDYAAAFDAVLDAGVDPREVAKINVTDLEDALGEDASAHLGESTYTYYRRES